VKTYVMFKALVLADYIKKHRSLPSRYITKSAATIQGWRSGKVDSVLPGRVIGGDVYQNRQGLLPQANYWECDIYVDKTPARGTIRLVFSDQNDFYLTLDHYITFIRIL